MNTAGAVKGQKPSYGRWQLLAAGLVMTVLWLFVFPALSRDPALQRKIAERERQGIHLHAMFYTELEVKDRHQAIDRMVEQTPAALWNPWAMKTTDRE